MNLKMLRIALGIMLILSFFPLHSTNAGAHTAWLQIARLNGVNGHSHDNFGNSVAVSGDTIVVGAPSATVGANGYQGEAFVYVKPPTGWTVLPAPAATLVLPGGLANQHFGSSVAISGDTIAVGAYGVAINGNTNQGAVYVFTRPAGGWSGTPAPAATLTASDGLALDGLGTTVSISGDTIVSGAFGAKIGSNSGQGAAYVFVKPNGSAWANHSESAKLVAAGGQAGEELGYDVSIDGDTVVVGTNHNNGAAYVFVRPTSGGWSGTLNQSATLLDTDPTGPAYFGKAVAISGSTVAVCDSGVSVGTHFFQGAIYIFNKPAGGWSGTPASAAKLTASNGGDGDLLGDSVAISGSVVAAGAPYATVGANNSQGAVYVFTKPAAGWSGSLTETAHMAASDGAADDNLGVAVGISGNTVAAGAWGAKVGAVTKVGAAYVFGGQYTNFMPVVKN